MPSKVEISHNKKIFNKKVFHDIDIGSISSSVIVNERWPVKTISILSPIERISSFDRPKKWIQEKYSIEKIASIRSKVVSGIKKKDKMYIDKLREIALSIKDINIDLSFKKLFYKPIIERGIPPIGGRGILRNIEINENPKVPRVVEKTVDDPDLKAGEAITTLYNKGIDEYYSYKLFSLGMIGTKIERHLVPTKWSITAIDDILGKNLYEKIRNYKWIEKINIVTGELYGNHYIILFIPGPWSYELFEAYLSRRIDGYAYDYEGAFGRKEYAKNTEGGYYAARLGILEKLEKIKRQATTIAIRIITPAYRYPLGVWVVREAVRKADKWWSTDSIDEAVKYVKSYAYNRLGTDISGY